MTPDDHRPRGRIIIPLLVGVLGAGLIAGGAALLRPLGRNPVQRLTAAADRRGTQNTSKPLTSAAIRARVEPSIVDVTATLTYDGETASGTGFVISAVHGLILTNNHVIRDATSVLVTIAATGEAYPASIVGADVPADIAVLRVTPAIGLSAVPLGNSTRAKPGMPVVSFGNQAGAGGLPTVSAGVITGTGRTIQADDGAAGFSETLSGMLATTAQIKPGDSGGPLADTAGRVIGVDTAAGTGGSKTGYAIPIDAAMSAVRLITSDRPVAGVSRGTAGFLGVVLAPGSAHSPAAQQAQERRAAPGPGGTPPGSGPAGSGCLPTQQDVTAPARFAPASTGALVAGVLCGTGAVTAGLAAGDVITAADGHRVDSPTALTAVMAGRQPGAVVAVSWISTAGRHRTAQVRLVTAPAL